VPCPATGTSALRITLLNILESEVVLSATEADQGKRLDHFLQERLPEFTRSRLQQWIKSGHIRVDGRRSKASHLMRGVETIEVQPQAPPPLHAEAEDLPVEILYLDDDVIAVNKPAGMAVHAGAGCHSGTLVNALMHHFGSLSSVGGEERPGIVHRLDRYTSGVLLVARTDRAHQVLQQQFAARTIEKHYLALVHGSMPADTGKITARITRDPVRRTRMTAKLGTGRTALTEYRVLRRFPKHSYIDVRIGTGRTHQIRVHLASIGHPVVGDTLYGAPADRALGRYFLHARRITFEGPTAGKPVTIEAPLAPELSTYLEGL
jgi:23S rRNA pseudouridine1911/1915/1917 synthase